METQFNAAAEVASVVRLKEALPNLPREYFEFLEAHDGAEGFLGISPGYFRLWASNEVLEMSAGYGISEYIPDYVAVGSSGGGELFVFPLTGQPSGIFAVPAIGMEPDTVCLVASTFTAFVAAFGGGWP